MFSGRWECYIEKTTNDKYIVRHITIDEPDIEKSFSFDTEYDLFMYLSEFFEMAAHFSESMEEAEFPHLMPENPETTQ